jgi:hypothetical protein
MSIALMVSEVIVFLNPLLFKRSGGDVTSAHQIEKYDRSQIHTFHTALIEQATSLFKPLLSNCAVFYIRRPKPSFAASNCHFDALNSLFSYISH